MTGSISPLERKRRPGVGYKGNGDNLGPRVAALESRMQVVELAANRAAENTDEILAVMTAAKSVGGFLKKHGPRAISFAFGLAAAAGVGNPKVIAFVQGFFGS